MSEAPLFNVRADWRELLTTADSPFFTAALPSFLESQRWFRSKARRVRAVALDDVVQTPMPSVVIALLRVSYADGDDETYLLPITGGRTPTADTMTTATAHICRVRIGDRWGEPWVTVSEATHDPALATALLAAMRTRAVWHGKRGDLCGEQTPELGREQPGDLPTPRVLGAEQTNTSIVYGERWILKLFRRLEAGTHPDLEVTRFLATAEPAAAISPTGGWLEYRRPDRDAAAVGLLCRFVANHGDAWQQALSAVTSFLHRARATPVIAAAVDGAPRHLIDLTDDVAPRAIQGAIGDYLGVAALLGERVGELHAALASAPEDPAFAPEPFDSDCLRGVVAGVEALCRHAFGLLRDRLAVVPVAVRPQAEALLASETLLQARLKAIARTEDLGQRIRHHGDLHLGQILFSGRDFTFIDFEGEPSRPLAERRRKGSALRDVAGMLRSFHYAALTPILLRAEDDADAPTPAAAVSLARLWQQWVSVAFLRRYLETTRAARFLPRDARPLLDLYLFEKAVYELAYELNNRPSWVAIPLDALARVATDSR